MGKLLSGRYGSQPDAESIALSLRDCNQKLNLKPSDFVSEGHPKFFEKAFGAAGRYLLFFAEDDDVQGNPIWRRGYYLLPLEAKDVLAALDEIPREFREVVLLSDVQEFSYKEIAEMLGIPVGTVMSRLSRGRKQLRMKLASYAYATGVGRMPQESAYERR